MEIHVTKQAQKDLQNIYIYSFKEWGGKQAETLYRLLQQTIKERHLFLVTWAQLYQRTFNVDPTRCPHCQINMLPSGYQFPHKFDLLSQHKVIALRSI